MSFKNYFRFVFLSLVSIVLGSTPTKACLDSESYGALIFSENLTPSLLTKFREKKDRLEFILEKQEKTLKDEFEIQELGLSILEVSNKMESEFILHLMERLKAEEGALREIFEIEKEKIEKELNKAKLSRKLHNIFITHNKDALDHRRDWPLFYKICWWMNPTANSLRKNMDYHKHELHRYKQNIDELRQKIKNLRTDLREAIRLKNVLTQEEVRKHQGHIRENELAFEHRMSASHVREIELIAEATHAQRLHDIQLLHGHSQNSLLFFNEVYTRFLVMMTVYQELHTGKISSAPSKFENGGALISSAIGSLPFAGPIAYAVIQGFTMLKQSEREKRIENVFLTFTPQSLKETTEILALSLTRKFERQIQDLNKDRILKKGDEVAKILYRTVASGEVLTHFEKVKEDMTPETVAEFLESKVHSVYEKYGFPKKDQNKWQDYLKF